jgi:hypothetical protein
MMHEMRVLRLPCRPERGSTMFKLSPDLNSTFERVLRDKLACTLLRRGDTWNVKLDVFDKAHKTPPP